MSLHILSCLIMNHITNYKTDCKSFPLDVGVAAIFASLMIYREGNCKMGALI